MISLYCAARTVASLLDEASRVPIDPTAIASRTLVRCPDGPAGLVERAIVSPRTGHFTHLVVERLGAPDTYWIVPASAVESAGPDGVRLSLDRETLNRSPAHSRVRGEWLRADSSLPAIVLPERRPDAAVEADVRRALATDPLLAADDLDVAADDGLVILRGLVPTALARLAAQKLAEGVPGVCLVRNDLQSDEEIGVALNSRLAEDPEFERHQVRARLERGHVYWEHHGAGLDLLTRASALAAAWPGVRSVEKSA